MPTLERERLVTPRIYVASLADYNNGNLHGRWIDADQDPEEIRAEVAAMLAGSREAVAEDWAIHDYEGFGPFTVGGVRIASDGERRGARYRRVRSGLRRVCQLGWHQRGGPSPVRLLLPGHWPNLEAYARDVASDMEWEAALDQLPESMRSYVDAAYDRLARDLDSEVTTVAGGGGLYVFRET